VTHKEFLTTTVVTFWVTQSCSTSLISTAYPAFDGSFNVETLPTTSLHKKAIKKRLAHHQPQVLTNHMVLLLAKMSMGASQF
jgi:hypothetical protein